MFLSYLYLIAKFSQSNWKSCKVIIQIDISEENISVYMYVHMYIDDIYES